MATSAAARDVLGHATSSSESYPDSCGRLRRRYAERSR